MSEYVITLTSSQEDALIALAAPLGLTAAQTLQSIVNAQLQVMEQTIEAAKAALMVAGQQLPTAIRERMTEGLTAEQLARVLHLGTAG